MSAAAGASMLFFLNSVCDGLMKQQEEVRDVSIEPL